MLVYVKKVEIFGFKSFGFKNTVVQFEPGLVSISGPNGSGKSNILDAIIFAMGENKPRIMRVDKLRSLIHDIEGSHNGRSPKMARSSVHFENSDRKLPVDTDTVEITREMDGSGENIYYLNKKKTTRGHILDLLDMANAGLGQLNAVQQGTVTRISEFSSEEKRRTIEDLIGLSYFDEKKTEAIKQLDEADRRLEIALAKMGEIKKRIDELEEERNQKLRHDMLEREINRYKAISAANKMKTISSQRSLIESDAYAVTDKITKFDEERDMVRTDIQELEALKSELMTKVNDYNKIKSALDTEISTAMEQYEMDNSAISASNKRIEQIDLRLPEIKAEMEDIEDTRRSISAQIIDITQSIKETNLQKDKINVDLETVDSERNNILIEQSAIAAKKSEIDKETKSLTALLNAAKLELSKFEHEQKESEIKIETNSKRLAELERDVAKLVGYKSRLESMIKNYEKTISELRSRIKGLQTRKTKIIGDQEELSLILEKASKAATQYESKIKTVKGFMPEDYTIAKLKDDAERLGIRGLVYEMLSWDKRYERAVLASGSDWLKAIVVNDFATLLGIAKVAKDKTLPKLKIIPLDAIPDFKFCPPKKVAGVLGVLSDYVACDPDCLTLKMFLFGNIILVQTRESAYNVSQLGYKAVTVNGEFFKARGSAVVIDINSKISKFTKLISMSSDIDGLFQSINTIKKYMSRKKHMLKKMDDSIQSYAQRLSATENVMTSANENLSNLRSRIISVDSLKERLVKKIAELGSRNSKIASEISANESQIRSTDQKIDILEKNSIGGEQSVVADKLSRVNMKKSDIEKLYTVTMNEYRDKYSQLTILQTQDNKERSQLDRLHNEQLSQGQERSELEQKIKDLERLKRTKSEYLIQLREKEQNLIATSGSSIGQLKGFDDKLKILHERDKELTRQTSFLERRSDSLGRDLADLAANEADLQKILSAFRFDRDMETFDVGAILLELTSELTSLNTLNAKAPETYAEISYGYRSMSVRKNSLEKERNTIVKFIEGIEKDKRQTFLDAFDKIDKEIGIIFSKMTGGNAWLELQNEDDIFSSGISYIIQFPNKPKRESTSISGGEKTLAAIVFVLALQKLKPSPFYLFDEIDAHLDAPNSERLSTILEERSKESQFIMVSLKDSVVKKAKLIYGVFPKNGVSNIVIYKDKRIS